MRKPFLRYWQWFRLRQSHRTGGTRVNNATVLAKIVADKAIWVEARKQQNRWPVFRMRFSRARDIFMMRTGCTHGVYSGVQKSVAVKRLIRDDFDPARIAAIYKHYASQFQC